MDEFDSSIHPCAVYAVPWIAVAYLVRNGHINSRCVTYINPDNPDDKRHSVIYGDSLLQTKLATLGYTFKHFGGVKIRRIVEGGRIVAPYIDDKSEDYTYQFLSGYDDDYMIIGATGELRADNTNGFAADEGSDDDDDDRECECCGDLDVRYNMYFNDRTDEYVCSCCWENYVDVIVDQRGNTQKMVVNSDDVVVTTDDRYFIDNARVLQAHGYTQLTSGYYDDQWAPSSDVVVDHEDDSILDQDAVECFAGYTWHKNQCVTTANGLVIARSYNYEADDFDTLFVKDGQFDLEGTPFLEAVAKYRDDGWHSAVLGALHGEDENKTSQLIHVLWRVITTHLYKGAKHERAITSSSDADVQAP
jgi:hypothetical protein